MNMQNFEIPLTPSTAQTFKITINGTLFTLTLFWVDEVIGGWVLNIDDQNGNPIVDGIPLITGTDLLEQYGYLQLGFSLYCVTDGAPFLPPQFNNLGVTSHLYVQIP
jgi:hypothetical protein